MLAQSPVAFELQLIKPLVRGALVWERFMMVEIIPHVIRKMVLSSVSFGHTSFDIDQPSLYLVISWIVVDLPFNKVFVALATAARADSREVDLDSRTEISTNLLY